MSENKKKFIGILKDNSCDIFPAPTDAQLAINVLCDYLLGENWYTANPVSTEQVNTEIVDSILMRYSGEYQRDIKREKKSMKKKRGILSWVKEKLLN